MKGSALIIALLIVRASIPVSFPSTELAGRVIQGSSEIFQQEERPIKIFILAGQSNAVGYNNTKELQDEGKDLAERLHESSSVLFWPGSNARPGFADQWTDLRTGVSDISDKEPYKDGCFGPEIGFALALHRSWPDEKIAIIKYAVGATGIARSEDYNDYIPSLTGFDDKGRNWYPGSADKHPGALYKDLMENIHHALRALERQGKTYEITGFLWMQGEHEAGISKKMAEDYGKILTLLRNTIRKDLMLNDLPFAVGEINSHTWAFGDIARKGQAEACRQDPESSIIKTTDLSREGIGGKAHFEANAMLELGDRFAEGMLRLLGKEVGR